MNILNNLVESDIFSTITEAELISGPNVMGDYVVMVLDITPEIAKHFITHNSKNRAVKTSAVNLYTSDIKDGKWLSNGENIIITRDGIVRDGQHRLLACIKANCTLKHTMVTVVNNEDANNYDLGVPRSVSDIATLRGKDSVIYKSKLVPAAFNCAINKAFAGKKKMTKPSVELEIENHEEAAEFIYYNMVSKRSTVSGVRRAPVIATVLNAYLSGVDTEILICFCRKLYTMIDLNEEEDDVIRRLAGKLSKMVGGGNRLTDEVYSYAQQALYGYINNISHKRLSTDINKQYYAYPIETSK